MIVKKNRKTLTHYTWLALLIVPSLYFKNLLFDNYFSLKFDKCKKKIYSINPVNNMSLPNSDADFLSDYIFPDNVH
ncbi:conserved Plasmodium protein, unknown function [Plasmodium knowlesi strain H]|uniref:Uncharacterized protein n=3 Tax=Plasmodium knowlesi TaxID=5850 RepID=A0A5K1U6Q8_PLAKH|nr:conserved Plasmodium protein, unknown function [Plasmodium knowlesi strain H]OTN65497.1 Uncharacterized protein PKNOH_S110088400 [Plasmodium knowlesi]CAA9989505.1 conserved Plasmodium protein, unknown function [Plasmodium knowlesi strain H]SBO25188.1 conserved Plasmodium protein, unknown function [Plasmodium knowlesi strain H]SBO27767.1 conserved Plasmodium protein, unknown function [Plasmodium knowlesi strain H]VVS78979.1 conserved Plasmodium protein, unknown function [Plasmodium knowlesi |eukprot:XP_002260230.1 hypothetical protein, conserved in Plasmodium species [Plasmodium knowlesi strain H]